MSTIPALSPPVPVQLCYSFQFGPLARENGKSRPVSLDANARDHGTRVVEQILEAPGQWVGVEPGNPAAPASREVVPTPPASPPRLPNVHPGTPAQMRVRVNLHVVRKSDTGWVVEHPTDPRGQVWLSSKHVLLGPRCGKYGCEDFRIRVWLWRKIVGQL